MAQCQTYFIHRLTGNNIWHSVKHISYIVKQVRYVAQSNVWEMFHIVKGEIFCSECQTHVKYLINQLTKYTLSRG